MMGILKPLLVGVLVVLAGTLVATAAAQSGDEAVDGIRLSPADTPNGDAYASLNGNGNLQVDVSALNGAAVTTIDSVFTISSTRDGEALVWVEPPSGHISFYRMDTGGSITTESSAVPLENGETITVGMRVDTRHSSVQNGTVTVRARLPEDDSAPSRGGSGDAPVRGPTTPEPDGEDADTPPTADPPSGDGPAPAEPGTDEPEGTPAPQDTASTPDPEVGGFPWLPLAGLLVGIALIPLLFFAYRRLRASGIRFETTAGSGLALSHGAYEDDHYRTDDGTVTFAFQQTSQWENRESEAPVAFTDVATLENTTEAHLEVSAVVVDGSPEGVRIAPAAGAGTDLLAEPVSVAPGESVALSVVFPEDYDGRRLAVRCEATEPASR